MRGYCKCRPGPRRAIGTGSHDREQIAGLRRDDVALERQEIARLADRPGDVGDDAFELLALFPNGFAWEVHYDVSVR
jgi:hypothetical protein